MKLRTHHSVSRLLVGLGLSVALLAPAANVSHASPQPQGIFALKVVAPSAYDRWANTDNQWTKNFRIGGLYLKDIVVGVSLVGTKNAAATFSIMHTNGLTLNYGYTSFRNQNFVAFKGKVSAVNKALADLRLNSYSGGKVTMKVVATTETSGVVFEPSNGHFFKYVPSPAITWDAAKAAAETQTFRGVKGYLATVTSEGENSFISSNIENASNIWLGGSDSAREGEYKWMTGPEKGKTFWQAACSTKPAGSADACNGANSVETLSGNQGTKYKAATIADTIVNTYSSWDAAGEPNNWGQTGENYVATNWQGSRGKWNDLSGDSRNISGYVVEFSGTKGGPAPQVVSGSTTIGLVALASRPEDVAISSKNGNVTMSWSSSSTQLPSSFYVNVGTALSGAGIRYRNVCEVVPKKKSDVYSCTFADPGSTDPSLRYLVMARYTNLPKNAVQRVFTTHFIPE
jgi:hypothetical protein